jgi:flagellar biosynthetic protein FliP
VRTTRPLRLLVLVGLICATASPAGAQTTGDGVDNPLGLPDVRKALPPVTDRSGATTSMAIFVLLSLLSIAPAILVMCTSFTRTVIVLSLLRQALGTQQLPPNQVIIGLSLILTLLTMSPTWRQIHAHAVEPYLAGRMSQADAFRAGVGPLREFMIRQIENSHNEENVYLFLEYSQGKPIDPSAKLEWSQVSLVELLPAFVLSELKTAFLMGVRIYLPFLIIDMVISAILISMGMMMLPPVLISLPFKLLLFVMADGWKLVVGSILSSFAVGPAG